MVAVHSRVPLSSIPRRFHDKPPRISLRIHQHLLQQQTAQSTISSRGKPPRIVGTFPLVGSLGGWGGLAITTTIATVALCVVIATSPHLARLSSCCLPLLLTALHLQGCLCCSVALLHSRTSCGSPKSHASPSRLQLHCLGGLVLFRQLCSAIALRC